MKPAIPISNIGPGILAQRDALEAAISAVLASGVFIDGPEVEAFEREMASYLGVRHCVGVNSGTDALSIGLRALGIHAGDEVIVPGFSFIATSGAVAAVGAVPVFVDIDEQTFNLDPAELRAALTSRTRAIIGVHLFGQAASMEEIMALALEHGLLVLEDVAQALGGAFRQRKLGSLGHAAALSFFPSKNLGAFGDAGLLATNDADVADVARQLRQHGGKDKYRSEQTGYNSRLDAIQAAVLRVKLPHLDANVARRRQAADRYDRLLRGAPGLQLPWRDPAATHTFHQYTLRIAARQRDGVRQALLGRGIQAVVYYPIPLHQQPVYGERSRGLVLPRAEAASATVLSLPIWPEIEEADQVRVAAAVCEALGG